MTELVARHTDGARVTMRGMFESATWPLRKLAWKIEEKVVWRVADAIRRRPPYRPTDSEYTPAQSDLTIPEPAIAVSAPEPVAAAASAPSAAGQPARRISLPSLPALRTPSRDLSIALATVAIAVGGGIGIATILGNDGGGGSSMPPASGGSAAAPQSQAFAGEGAAQPSTLQGVPPDFAPVAKTKAAGEASATPAKQAAASPTQGTNSKPSAIPPGVAGKPTAMKTARGFAGAFVLYEVGKSNAKVRRTFKRTATPTLARALSDRPPRLPESVRVPTAKVQNIVLSPPSGRTMEASVALLRLGDLSELRLSLARRGGAWRVGEVRG
jgi:hypothetical protein